MWAQWVLLDVQLSLDWAAAQGTVRWSEMRTQLMEARRKRGHEKRAAACVQCSWKVSNRKSLDLATWKILFSLTSAVTGDRWRQEPEESELEGDCVVRKGRDFRAGVCRRPGGRYFRLYGSYSLWHSYLTLPLDGDSSHRYKQMCNAVFK